jgi:hypothetical protein
MHAGISMELLQNAELLYSRWMVNGETFLQWLQFFVEQVHPTATKKVLLVLDNHKCHNLKPCCRKQCAVPVICTSYDAENAGFRYGPLKPCFEKEIYTLSKIMLVV